MTDDCVRVSLLQCPLFKQADNRVLQQWLDALTLACERYEQNQVINFQGDAYDQLKVLISGRVSAQFQDYSGKVMRVETLEAPEAVATAVLFSREQKLPVTLVAETEVSLVRISKKALLNLMQRDISVLENLLTDMGDRLVFLAEKARLLRFSNLRQKIASYLLSLFTSMSRTVELPYTREKLAEMFGVERPSLSRELSRMDEEGIISLDGKRVTVPRIEDLEEILDLFD